MPDRPAPTISTSKCSAVSVMTFPLLPRSNGPQAEIATRIVSLLCDTRCIEVPVEPTRSSDRPPKRRTKLQPASGGGSRGGRGIEIFVELDHLAAFEAPTVNLPGLR